MNIVSLIGRLTANPEIRYTQTNNVMVATFTLAVNRRFAKEGEKQADFIYVTTWGKTAEFASKHISKRQQIALTGRLEQHEWENTEGKKQSKTQVIAEQIYFADSKTTGQADASILDSQTPVNTNNNFKVSTEDDLPF